MQDQGVVAVLGQVASFGQHADGSWWAVPTGAGAVMLQSTAIAAGETADLFIGGCMVDPGRPARPDIKKHGFDWRTTGNKTNPAAAPVGSGPGTTYDASYALTLPAAVTPYSDGPTTIWIYRGVDNADLVTGGGASGCARMVQLTIYASAPAAGTIKPPGLYVAGGKPVRTRGQINYAALPSHALPSGAVEPDWDSASFHRYPTWRWGDRNNAAAITPMRTQTKYPADQAVFTNMVAVGACLNIARRNELIERLVRDGLEAHACTAFAPVNNAYFAGGGFGPGGKLPRFVAGIVLGDAALLAEPPQITFNSDGTGPLMAFFAEDCSTYWSVRKIGDVANVGGTYQALFGTRERYDGDYAGQHTGLDPAGLRDSYRLAQFRWTVESVAADGFVVTAASHDFGKVYQPDNSIDQGYHRALKIMTGANAGGWAFLSQEVSGIDVSWNAATRKVTIERTETWALPVTLPSVGDVVEYRPAAGYEQIAAAPLTGAALAVVMMGKVSEYCIGEPQRALFAFAKDWITAGGKLADKKSQSPPFQRSNSTVSCTWGPGEAVTLEGNWLAKIYPAFAASWPVLTGPVGG